MHLYDQWVNRQEQPVFWSKKDVLFFLSCSSAPPEGQIRKTQVRKFYQVLLYFIIFQLCVTWLAHALFFGNFTNFHSFNRF